MSIEHIKNNQSKSILSQITEISGKIGAEISIMEVCGTHTVSIARHGIRSLIPPNIRLVSGPGCPVCVTSQGAIDAMIKIAEMPDCRVVTFGDMMRVPGTDGGSLMDRKGRGAKVNIVYSPMDALYIAQKYQDDLIVFLAVGFETTAPLIASVIKRASKEGVKNFTVFPAMKLIMPAIFSLLSQKDVMIDGLICPGHVSSVIGADVYEPVCSQFNAPCVIAGFDAHDILGAIRAILMQLLKIKENYNNNCYNDRYNDCHNREISTAKGKRTEVARVENLYRAVVDSHGNKRALSMIKEVFEHRDSVWRGLGIIEKSGLFLRDEYMDFCAISRLKIDVDEGCEHSMCRCKDILTGRISPPDCPLFKRACTPLNPFGPCMVSNEGACHAYYNYA